MTSRQVYEALLVEMNKTDAPNIQLEDFNYFVNKAIYQYVNKRYNIYDINQQTTDDLRVLKSTTRLIPKPVSDDIYEGLTTTGKLAIYECILPSDYLHMLNCVCIYKVHRTYKCYNKNDIWRTAAKRLTADAYSQVLDNYWNRPTYKKPYYYIHNVNTNNLIPTNPYDNGQGTDVTNVTNVTITNTDFQNSEYSTDQISKLIFEGEEYDFKKNYKLTSIKYNNKEYKLYYYQEGCEIFLIDSSKNFYILLDRYGSWSTTQQDYTVNSITKVLTLDGSISPLEKEGTFSIVIMSEELDWKGNKIANTSASGNFAGIKIGKNDYISNIERGGEIRYGNASQVRMEIRYGTDTSIFELIGVLVDYIKAPQNIRLTQEQLDWTEDRSQVLEFPDYVCQEIINELVHIIMENIGDPKLQTHPIVSQSIANPAQQQTEPVAQAT